MSRTSATYSKPLSVHSASCWIIDEVIVPATCPLYSASTMTALPVLFSVTSSPFRSRFRTALLGELSVVCCDRVAHLSPACSTQPPPPPPDTFHLHAN